MAVRSPGGPFVSRLSEKYADRKSRTHSTSARQPGDLRRIRPDARRKFVTEFLQLAGGQTTEIGSTRVTALEVTHASGAPSFAFRVEVAGRTIAYSGDTEWTDALIPVARGADLFICEAYYYEKDIPFHLNFRTLMEHRSKLDCDRIMLTHMSADMLARLADLDIEASHDGLEIEL